MLVQIHTKQKIIGNFWMGMAKNGLSQSGDGTLKLTEFEE